MTTDQKQTEGQIITAIDREFGSGGREIADLLGHYFGLPVYEKTSCKILASGIRKTSKTCITGMNRRAGNSQAAR